MILLIWSGKPEPWCCPGFGFPESSFEERILNEQQERRMSLQDTVGQLLC
jgi:hypothetical protein